MKEILNLTQGIRKKSHDIGEEITNEMGIKSHEIPASVFPMIFNDSTVLLELLSHYFDAWEKATSTRCSSVEEAKKENSERVILTQKMVFIQILSSVEFSFKAYVRQYPKKLSQFKGRVYLRKIMEESKEQGIISDSDFSLWEGVIELRNVLVHNNGISEKTGTYVYPECKIEFNDNKMIQRNLKLFPFLTDWLLDASREWLIEMDRR